MTSNTFTNTILKATLNAVTKMRVVPEDLPSCATCAHAHPVPDCEAGNERNVYCRAVDYSERPNGLKIRRTAHCSLYRPDAVTVRAEIVPLLRETFGGWGIEIRHKANANGKGALHG